MKIALVTYCKITNVEQYLPSNCTEILTNNLIIASLTASVPITYVPDLDEVIKNSDYVSALCSRKIKKIPPIISRSKRYNKSFEFYYID